MYTITTKSFAVQEAPLVSPLWMFRDVLDHWEQFHEEDLAEHFNNIHALYAERIEALRSEQYHLTPQKEKELLFMFEALLQAKLAMQDRD